MSQSGQAKYDIEDEIDLKEIFHIIWAGRWYILIAICLFTLVGLAYALYKKNIYQANVLVIPVQEETGHLASIGSQLGGLANLAGVSLGSDRSNKATLAIEIMRSNTFLKDFILRNDLVKPLFAVEGWDPAESRWIYDTNRYNPESGTWLTDDEGESQRPSDWEMVTVFKEDHLRIAKNDDTGMVTVGIRHYSPELSKEIVETLLSDINEYMRRQDVEESEARIEYLEAKLRDTSITDMQKMFYQLIESETRTLMLANARKEYIFETVDPALMPEEPVEPKRLIILIVAVLLGTGTGIFIALMKALFINEKGIDLE